MTSQYYAFATHTGMFGCQTLSMSKMTIFGNLLVRFKKEPVLDAYGTAHTSLVDFKIWQNSNLATIGLPVIVIFG